MGLNCKARIGGNRLKIHHRQAFDLLKGREIFHFGVGCRHRLERRGSLDRERIIEEIRQEYFPIRPARLAIRRLEPEGFDHQLPGGLKQNFPTIRHNFQLRTEHHTYYCALCCVLGKVHTHKGE